MNIEATRRYFEQCEQQRWDEREALRQEWLLLLATIQMSFVSISLVH